MRQFTQAFKKILFVTLLLTWGKSQSQSHKLPFLLDDPRWQRSERVSKQIDALLNEQSRLADKNLALAWKNFKTPLTQAEMDTMHRNGERVTELSNKMKPLFVIKRRLSASLRKDYCK